MVVHSIETRTANAVGIIGVGTSQDGFASSIYSVLILLSNKIQIVDGKRLSFDARLNS